MSIAQQISAGNEILGEIIAWQLTGIKVSYKTLVTAFRDNDLDESIVRTKLPRHAFAQAARQLSDQRVIDKLDEDTTDIRFQFTRRFRENGEFEYVRECVLTLSKGTGRVYCDEDPELAELAEELVFRALDTYTGTNIGGYLRDLFRENADIFSFPDDGGVYLVPAAHSDFIAKVERFVSDIGGKLRRLPVAKGTEHGDRAFREAIAGQIERTIRAHIEAIDKLTPENQNRTFENRAKEINESRYKVECYAAYLGSESARLLRVVADAKQLLRDKILEASSSVEVN